MGTLEWSLSTAESRLQSIFYIKVYYNNTTEELKGFLF